MNTVIKGIVFLKLNKKTKLLLLEAVVYLAWARILLLLPFSRLAPLLGTLMQETPHTRNEKNKDVIKEVSSCIYAMSNHTFWESKCFVRAIAGMKMLEKRRIESTLYLGTSKDKTGKMIAHAWLRSGSFYITGIEGMERFTVVGKFAKTITD